MSDATDSQVALAGLYATFDKLLGGAQNAADGLGGLMGIGGWGPGPEVAGQFLRNVVEPLMKH
ncbi:hypothetical protein [Embleya sp. NPDC001921]